MYNILNGIRVLDLGRYISGPSCCRILADMGAEVIKVEKAGYGDQARYNGPIEKGVSIYYPAYNRNKKSVTINFRSEKGQTLLRRLIAKSDVIVENFKAGTMKAMGLSFEEISKINPRAILVSISGFGQDGPDAKLPAYDLIVSYRAHLYSKTEHGEFAYGPNLMSDNVSGLNAVIATMLALYNRERTGKGTHVDFCMLSSSVFVTPIDYAYHAVTGSEEQYFIDAPNGNYETKDGCFVNITGGPIPMFTKLRELIDDPVIKDEKYLIDSNRVEDHVILEGCVAAWVKARPLDEVLRIMSENGITCGKINSWKDVLNDEVIKYRGDAMNLPVEGLGEVPYPQFPAKFSGIERVADTPAPELGQDNYAILTELLGMSPEEVEEYTN